MKKLQENRGEMLVEVLASILIASLSVALLFSCVTASSKMDGSAQNVDESHYAALSAAEGQTGTPVSGTDTVTIKNTGTGGEQSVEIEIYGGAETYSYKRAWA